MNILKSEEAPLLDTSVVTAVEEEVTTPTVHFQADERDQKYKPLLQQPLASSPPHQVKKGQWKVGLWSQCCDYPKNFLLSLCCPCVRVALSAARAKLQPELGYGGWLVLVLLTTIIILNPLIWPWCSAASISQIGSTAYDSEVWFPWCGMWWLALPAYAGVCSWVRAKIRNKYNIAEPLGVTEDALDHALISCCAIAQEAVEVDLAERGEVVASLCLDDIDLRNGVSTSCHAPCCAPSEKTGEEDAASVPQQASLVKASSSGIFKTVIA